MHTTRTIGSNLHKVNLKRHHLQIKAHMHSDIDTGGRRIRPDRAIMRPDMREAAFGFNEIESSSTTYSDGGELPLNVKRS